MCKLFSLCKTIFFINCLPLLIMTKSSLIVSFLWQCCPIYDTWNLEITLQLLRNTWSSLLIFNQTSLDFILFTFYLNPFLCLFVNIKCVAWIRNLWSEKMNKLVSDFFTLLLWFLSPHFLLWPCIIQNSIWCITIWALQLTTLTQG